MNLIFCGTPQFAVPTLEKLIAEGFSPSLVLTNPDEPSGRGYATKPSPVKEAAVRAGLEIFQPSRLKDPGVQEKISSVQPEVIVVVAYGHLIPPWMFNLPPLGCINLHASLLPRYRGAAPIAWSIIRGERVTGVTTMKIDQGLDTGDILLQKEVGIGNEDTTETLSERLSREGAQLVVTTLRGLLEGKIQPRPQNPELATLAPILKKEDGLMDWSLTAEEIARWVRGLRPWPVAHTLFRGKNLQIWAARPWQSAVTHDLKPGELKAEGASLIVGCGGHTLLEILELQLEGRRRVPARDFMNGFRLQPGEMLQRR